MCFFCRHKLSRQGVLVAGYETKVLPGSNLRQDSLDNYADLHRVTVKDHRRRNYLSNDDDDVTEEVIQQVVHDHNTTRTKKSKLPNVGISGRFSPKKATNSDEFELHNVFQEQPTEIAQRGDNGGDSRVRSSGVKNVELNIDSPEDEEPVELPKNIANNHRNK